MGSEHWVSGVACRRGYGGVAEGLSLYCLGLNTPTRDSSWRRFFYRTQFTELSKLHEEYETGESVDDYADDYG